MKRIHKQNSPADNTLNTRKTGQLLFEAGLVALKDIKHALEIQKNSKDPFLTGTKNNKLLGMILCDLNLITPVDLYYILHKNNKIYTLKNLLSSNEKFSGKMADIIAREQAYGVYSFFDLIVEYNILSIESLQQYVFELYHIPYRRVNRFEYDWKDKKKLSQLLDKETCFKNLAIPMVKRNSSFILGITDPKSLIFIYNLNFKLPHYRIIPVFIPLRHLKTLYHKLYNIIFPDNELSIRSSASLNGDVPPYTSNLSVNSSDSKANRETGFFLKHKIIISDPEKEENLISDLYSKYENLRQLMGKQSRSDKFMLFKLFIKEKFKYITESYFCKSIEIILYGEQDNISIIAKPDRPYGHDQNNDEIAP